MATDPTEKFDWSCLEEEFLGRVDNHSNLPHKKTAKITYQDTLERVSESMIRFKKPEHLIKMINRMIDRQVGVTHVAVLLYKPERKSFVLIDSEGRDSKKALVNKVEFSLGNPLISACVQDEMLPLLNDSGVLVYDLLGQKLHDNNFDARLAGKVNIIKQQMEMLGASICIPSYFKKELLGILILGDKISGEKFTREEVSFLLTLANNAAMAVSNAQLIETLQEKVKEVETLYEKFHSLFIRISIALATAIDARDPYTHGHTVRVTSYCLSIAEELQHTPEVRNIDNFRESLHVAALLHDIGKIGIPDIILHKKEKLTIEEFEKIKEHPSIGAAILYPIRDLSGIVGGVRSHQERYDGNGYPDRLKGRDIPFLARIISVADAFDAITSDRPYKMKKSPEEAIEEITRYSGTQFDPQIADAFRKIYNTKRFLNPV